MLAKPFMSRCLTVGGLAAAAMSLPLGPALAWEPTKPVEIIVPAGPGGASDQMARMIQGIVTKYQLMTKPLIVTTKGGANGAEGYMAIKAAKGDPHKFIIANSALYSIPLGASVPFNWKDMSPVAMLALDEFLLWVNSESPYKTTQDFIAAAKAAPPESMKVGGTGSKKEDHIIVSAAEAAAGVRFSYIPYKSGAEAATQLVGKHIEANTNNPSENIGQWRAGQVRALCVFDDKKMPYDKKVTADQAWGDIPTCRDQGLDVQYVMLRAILLPGGASKDQVAFYEDLFRKIVEKPEFKDYLETNALDPEFKTGDDLVKFLEKDEQLHRDLMGKAGFLATTN